MNALVLPRRYERLEEAAHRAQQDVSRIVARVESGLVHLQELFAGMHQGDVGGVDIFFGPSGAGKTTFLATCWRFFEGLTVHRIEHSVSLTAVSAQLAVIANSDPARRHIVYLHDRENQRDSPEAVIAFLDDLRRELRRIGPNVLVVWPVSREDYAKDLLDLAQRTGADSLLPNGPKYFRFEGPAKDDYYTIADDTAKLFNGGRSLSEFGISEVLARQIAQHHSTIASYLRH